MLLKYCFRGEGQCLKVLQPRLFRNLVKDMYTEPYRAPRKLRSAVWWSAGHHILRLVGLEEGGRKEEVVKEKAQPRMKKRYHHNTP